MRAVVGQESLPSWSTDSDGVPPMCTIRCRVNASTGRRTAKETPLAGGGPRAARGSNAARRTVGVSVYDENVVSTNTVDFVATWSRFTITEFAAGMAIAFSRNTGGENNWTSTTFHEFGAKGSKRLRLSYGTTSIGVRPAFGISGAGVLLAKSSLVRCRSVRPSVAVHHPVCGRRWPPVAAIRGIVGTRRGRTSPVGSALVPARG